ncbi:MAG TPA: hypothetical protein DCS93_24785 [Microscillaceae bacterium]|nr:hypothetical protein [Microscillaceae bacterium]
MKHLILSTTLLILLCSCGHSQNHQSGHGHSGHSQPIKTSNFKSEKITKSATITLNGNIDKVFPLFNPIDEQKWAPMFKPHFIYPSDNTIQEGMSFKTAGHGGETEYLWIITKYTTTTHLIQYLVSTANRYWTITVDCKQADKRASQTLAKITYTFYALNKKGKAINKKAIHKMYAKNLKDWEKAINTYLKK